VRGYAIRLFYGDIDEMRVCYFGTYRREYSRNQIMIEALRRSGNDVIECQVDLWHGVNDRVKIASGGWANLGFALRLIKAYTHLIVKIFKIKNIDIFIVGYPGQLDVIFADLISWLRARPVADSGGGAADRRLPDVADRPGGGPGGEESQVDGRGAVAGKGREIGAGSLG